MKKSRQLPFNYHRQIDDQCGQTCVAMLTGFTPEDICKFMANEGSSNIKQVEEVCRYLGVPIVGTWKKSRFRLLPKNCLIMMNYPGLLIGHLIVRYKGKYYNTDLDDGNGFDKKPKGITQYLKFKTKVINPMRLSLDLGKPMRLVKEDITSKKAAGND